jgi:endonuclease III
MAKRRFDIDEVMGRVAAAVAELPKAALFELAEEGFTSAFEQLVACILSIRTRDEVMLPAARAFFADARSPAEVAALGPAGIASRIRACTFAGQKARTIHDLATHVLGEFGGELPCDEKGLLSLRGVGPKCANLVLGIACGTPRIGVDIHVHRVTNRWGYVQATTPAASLRILESKLPKEYWVEINRVLVPFGKHICQGKLPRCSTCPVLDMCCQVGVTSHR